MSRLQVQYVDGKWVVGEPLPKNVTDRDARFIAVGENYQYGVFDSKADACAAFPTGKIYRLVYYRRYDSDGEEEILPISTRIR